MKPWVLWKAFFAVVAFLLIKIKVRFRFLFIEEVRNWFHVSWYFNLQSGTELPKLFLNVFEWTVVKTFFSFQVMAKQGICHVFVVDVLLNQGNNLHNHLGHLHLSAMRNTNWQVTIYPNLYFSFAIYEYHFFPYVKVAVFSVQKGKPTQTSLQQIQIIFIRNVVHFLQPHFHLLKVYTPGIKIYAKVSGWGLSEMLYPIDPRRRIGALMTPLFLFTVLMVLFNAGKVEIIFLNVLMGNCVEEESTSVDVDVLEGRVRWIREGNPIL